VFQQSKLKGLSGNIIHDVAVTVERFRHLKRLTKPNHTLSEYIVGVPELLVEQVLVIEVIECPDAALLQPREDGLLIGVLTGVIASQPYACVRVLDEEHRLELEHEGALQGSVGLGGVRPPLAKLHLVPCGEEVSGEVERELEVFVGGSHSYPT
jgi:hypothetical protein